MTSLLVEQRYDRKIKFFAERLKTCEYRFYNFIQIRRKEIPRLEGQESNESLQIEVQDKVLGAADTYINCLHGEHYSKDIPEYLTQSANQFKSLAYTRLAPKFVLEEQRHKLLESIFPQFDTK